MRPGDVISVLLGCYDPLVLQPKDEYFEVVGPCYASRIPKDEAFSEVNPNTKTIGAFGMGELKMVDVEIH
jgi:hypothetical protein